MNEGLHAAIKQVAEATTKSSGQDDEQSKKNRLSQAVLNERAAKAAIHWEKCFEDLKDFKEKFGHCLVPKSFKENQSLAYWVQRNRRHYALYQKGEQSLLTAERVKRLEDLDFVFRAKGAEVQAELEKKNKREKGVKKWNRHFQEMCEYKETHGNCLVPKQYTENRALASWVYNQRFQYKKKLEGQDVPLDDQRIKKLNEIGFCWKAKSDEEWRVSDRVRRRENSQDGWESKYERLVKFKEKHGHTLVPKQYKSDQSLSSWVFRQRRQYKFLMDGKPSSLSNDRLEKLKEIGFAFRVRSEKNEDEEVKNTTTESEDKKTEEVVQGDNLDTQTKKGSKTKSVRKKRGLDIKSSSLPHLTDSKISTSTNIEAEKEHEAQSAQDKEDVEEPSHDKVCNDQSIGALPSEATQKNEPKLMKKMILSSESDPDSSDGNSFFSSDDESNKDGSSRSGYVSSDQYEKSDDEIPIATPVLMDSQPVNASENIAVKIITKEKASTHNVQLGKKVQENTHAPPQSPKGKSTTIQKRKRGATTSCQTTVKRKRRR